MIRITCPKCKKSAELEDRAAGRRARCTCGESIPIPKDAPRDGRSATGRALEEALRVAEGKPAAAAPAAAGEGQPFKITPRQGMVVGGVAVAVMVAWLGYTAVAPSGWESEHRQVLTSLKREADALAAAGKPREAAAKYGQVIRLVAGVNLKGAEIKKTVDEARAARDALVAQTATLANGKSRP